MKQLFNYKNKRYSSSLFTHKISNKIKQKNRLSKPKELLLWIAHSF